MTDRSGFEKSAGGASRTPSGGRRRVKGWLVGVLTLALTGATLAACVFRGDESADPLAPAVADPPRDSIRPSSRERRDNKPRAEPRGKVSLAFVGDIHFELHVAAMLEQPQVAIGPMARTLRSADLAIANLETSITSRGVPLHADHPFRTSPAALDVLDAAGIDVVSMANNHAVDYGPVGLRDTLRAIDRGPVEVIGIGDDASAAFEPYRTSVRSTNFAFFGASSEPDQLLRSAAGPETAGIAAAFDAQPARLINAVRKASRRDDVVVVYLHWGVELETCPTQRQRETARALARAGADIIAGSHAHVLLGSGWMGRTYVNYGLGNFIWYHNALPETGVLQVQIRDGEVVGDSWTPARITLSGRPAPLTGAARAQAVAEWERLRGCTGLTAKPSS